jgi:hypothetical protein
MWVFLRFLYLQFWNVVFCRVIRRKKKKRKSVLFVNDIVLLKRSFWRESNKIIFMVFNRTVSSFIYNMSRRRRFRVERKKFFVKLDWNRNIIVAKSVRRRSKAKSKGFNKSFTFLENKNTGSFSFFWFSISARY